MGRQRVQDRAAGDVAPGEKPDDKKKPADKKKPLRHESFRKQIIEKEGSSEKENIHRRRR